MSRFYYDFHIHSCLSPCADDDNTPNNIAGMAKLSEIDIMALTDHNTCKNCPAFFEAARRYGIVPIAGMELTTSEDIHAVCLFERLEDALAFSEEVEKRRILIENRTDIFGNQFILDGEDNKIGEERYLLSNATTISIEDAPSLAQKFGGVCYPAHIDRDSNGIISVLGDFPPTPSFKCVELHDMNKETEYTERYALSDKIVLFGSDAHYLTDIPERERYLELEADASSEESVRKALFKLLR